MVLTLRYRKLTNKIESEIVVFWKKYAEQIVEAMTSGIIPEDLKLNFVTWTDEDIEKLMSFIDTSYKQLTVKYLSQLERITHIPEIDLSSIKENKKIHSEFVHQRNEHIKYFKKFPKYVKSKMIEHLEESKEKVTFDAKKLAETISLVEGMSRRHANFIARDQMGKFMGAINEAQDKALGCTRYIWKTVGDNRVRPEHREREGKIFYYNNPPKGGNPSFDYRCRCHADAILPNFKGEFE